MSIGFGVIGCGAIGAWHCIAINDAAGAHLVGVTDAFYASACKFSERFGVPAYESVDAMLADPKIDCVTICTPSGLHADLAVRAAEAGKHVLVEKPMALTCEDADRIIAAADRHHVKVGVVFQARMKDSTKTLKRLVDSGALGKIITADVFMKYYRSPEYYLQGGWRGTWKMDGGGALMNQGIHGVDVFRHLMGPVKSVHALTRTLTRRIEVEDSAAAVLEFESGALGTLQASTTASPGYPRRIEICGEAGSVALEEDSIARWDLPIPCALPVGEAAKNVGAANPLSISNAGHLLQIRNFVDAILHGAPLTAGAATGRPPLEIILAVYESSRTGKTVYLDDFSRI